MLSFNIEQMPDIGTTFHFSAISYSGVSYTSTSTEIKCYVSYVRVNDIPI